MSYTASIYTEEWFARRERFHAGISQITHWLIDEYGPFGSSLDLGAGDGWYSHVLANAGTDAHAVELSELALSYMPVQHVECIVHDLREPLDLECEFDLVLCIEVAEHLPELAAGVLCDTIIRHCNGLLVFTAAPPGQVGFGHVNCQPAQYWHERLAERGLAYLPEETGHVRAGWKSILGDNMKWLPANVTLYENPTSRRYQ